MLNRAATQILNVGNDFARSFRLREAPSLLLSSKSRPQIGAHADHCALGP